MIKAMTGDTVKVHYTGKLADGTVFDASPQDRPLHFILGRKEVVAGFDQAVTGMYQGEKKTAVISADDAYGPHDATLVTAMPRSQFGGDIDFKVGLQLEVTAPSGDKFFVIVAGLDEENVVLDANHPLAGRELTFDIELLEVEKKKPL
jgi:peptidylprolyl isomerase